MALVHTLMRYKNEGRVKYFTLYNNKKATIVLPNNISLLVYMSSEYIIGESEIIEATEEPVAQYLLYNNWDNVTRCAFDIAKRIGIEIHKFGAFGFILDELNDRL